MLCRYEWTILACPARRLHLRLLSLRAVPYAGAPGFDSYLLIPLAVYITLLRIDGKIGRVGFVPGLIALLLFQFLSSTEIIATATVFGLIALALGCMLSDGKSRLTLISIAKEVACAYAVVTIVLAPYLYYVFAPGVYAAVVKLPAGWTVSTVYCAGTGHLAPSRAGSEVSRHARTDQDHQDLCAVLFFLGSVSEIPGAQ